MMHINMFHFNICHEDNKDRIVTYDSNASAVPIDRPMCLGSAYLEINEGIAGEINPNPTPIENNNGRRDRTPYMGVFCIIANGISSNPSPKASEPAIPIKCFPNRSTRGEKIFS